MRLQINDGGRADAGFKGTTGDCVVRSCAIALGIPYREVYDDLFRLSAKTPRLGVSKKHYRPYLESKGFVWKPTMALGTGCRVHLRADELPSGRLVVRVTKHLTAVIDGIIHDTHDPSRDGTRCVYGFFYREEK